MGTITFEKLKKKINKQIQNPKGLAMKYPGEYCFDRMLQMLNKIPRTDLHQHCGYSQEKIKELHQIINDFDIRCLNDLIDFCKKFNLNIPRWLYKDYGVELSDEGWIIFSNENNFGN